MKSIFPLYSVEGPGAPRALRLVREHGHAVDGAILEIYVNDPNEVPAQSLLTEVMIPLA